MRFRSLYTALFMCLAASCVQDKPFEKPEDIGGDDKPPVEQKEPLPEMGSYETLTLPNVSELSGLCLNKAKTSLLGVGDKGSVYEIGFDGATKEIWTKSMDMEDITLDPGTGDIYIAVEREQSVVALHAPGYSTFNTMFYVEEAVNEGYGNDGLEGISYYKDNMFFVGSQKNANVWLYKKDGTMVSKMSLSNIMSEVASICYDSVKDWLWITDSNEHMIHIVTREGKLVASYDISWTENAESICVDRARGVVWVADDSKANRLYKISFTF